MRFPFAPLEALAFAASSPEVDSNGCDVTRSRLVARSLNTSLDQVYRWRKYGLDPDQADRFAVAAGLHPCEVWPAWFDLAGQMCGLEGCDELVSSKSMYCSRAHGRKARLASAEVSRPNGSMVA